MLVEFVESRGAKLVWLSTDEGRIYDEKTIMKKDEFELRVAEKELMRHREIDLIKADPSKAIELGRSNFFLKGADLQSARKGKNFVIFKDNEPDVNSPEKI